MSNQNNIRIIHYDDLPLGGFAGIVEKQMVLNPDLWPKAKDREDISHGFGDFIYLSKGYFKPDDGAPLHPHNNVDIVSVVLSGKLGHKGTLGDGTIINAPEVQTQRTGTGIKHAEFNVGKDDKADFVQIWFRPPEKDLEPDYKNFKLSDGKLTTVLGGDDGETFHSAMKCQAGFLSEGEMLETDKQFIAILTEGRAVANDIEISEGDLIDGHDLSLVARSKIGLILIQKR